MLVLKLELKFAQKEKQISVNWTMLVLKLPSFYDGNYCLFRVNWTMLVLKPTCLQ